MSIHPRCVRVHLKSGKVTKFDDVLEYVAGFDYFYINIDGSQVYIIKRDNLDFVERQTSTGIFKKVFLRKKKERTAEDFNGASVAATA